MMNVESYRQYAADCVRQAQRSWAPEDGPLMIDYSTQQPGERLGAHAESIDTRDFRRFVKAVNGADFDIMLEIKDKEKSAVKAAQEKSERRGGRNEEESGERVEEEQEVG